MTKGSRRFAARAFAPGDDGHGFETFVFECFRYAREERGFAKRLLRGRDGAVDLLDCPAHPGATLIAECKFIGSEDARDAPGRWAEVFRTLERNLPGLSADAAKAPRSPYRAWLNPERPVTRYRFCVTARMSPDAVAALQARIAADFGKLVAQGVEPLRHLAEDEGAVQVLPWEWFDAELDEHPALAFRWFRGLPVGVEPFAGRSTAEPSFRNFLESGALRYFSREQFVADTGAPMREAERDLVASLADGRSPALLITGPGGVGKTRLSLELATSLCGDPHGFDAYLLGRSATFASVIELLGHYPTGRSVLLVIDYAEVVPALAGIADAVAHLLANTDHRVRLIATCRSSANTQVRDSLAPLDLGERGLGSTRSGEAEYIAWVTRSILSLEPFPGLADLSKVCHGVPALAAFALFLFRHHRDRFDLQFGALHGLDTFGRWFDHRIGMLIGRSGNRRAHERALAHVALALPIPEDRYSGFSGQWGSLLDALRTDRWIEHHNGAYHAVHDVFADALAARWLFEAEHAATDRALELLDEAARRLDLAHALTSLERLAPHPRFGDIDGARVIGTLLATHPAEAESCCGLILRGKLLDYEAKLQVLRRSAALQQVMRRERSLDGVLSHLAAEAVLRRLTAADHPALATLAELLDHACDEPQNSNLVLRRAYALDPARFRVRARASVAAYAGAEPTHFLLVEMLKQGEPPASIGPVVGHWLARHACAHRASHLYRAWLNAGGSIDAVAAQIVAWLGAHERAEDAQYVHTAWLAAGGGTAAVATSLFVWFDAHGLTENARFPYREWLEAGGSVEAIAARCIAWIGIHGGEEGAQIVYSAWLRAGGDIEAIRELLLGWMALHGHRLEARVVFKAWLDARGGTKAVAAPLLAWLDVHGSTEGAKFVHASWLNAGGELEAVAASLIDWTRTHGEIEGANFVYTAWLAAGGSTAAVAGPSLAWLDAFGHTENAQYVLRAWLEAKGEFDVVREATIRWVSLWGETPDFVYLSKILSRQKRLPEPIVIAIARWCGTYPQNDDCLYRLSALVEHLDEDEVSFAARSFLLNVIAAVITIRRDLSMIDRRLLRHIARSLTSRRIYNFDPIGAARTASVMVARGTVFDRDLDAGDSDHLTPDPDAVMLLVRQGLLLGLLCPERDRVGLVRLRAWLARHAERSLRRLTEVLDDVRLAPVGRR